MAERVGPALAAVLRTRRDHFNALAAEARLLGGGFTAEAFVDALTGPVDDLASAVADRDTRTVEELVEVAYRAALTLTARGIDLTLTAEGSGHPVARLWALLAAHPSLIAPDPRRVLASLTNATLAIQHTPGARVGEWCDRISLLAGMAREPVTLLAAGRLAAWSCGMAHHRSPALAVLDALPRDIVATALAGHADGMDGWDPTVRWSGPDRRDLVEGRPVGDFAGLGGPFTLPPVVWADGDTLYAADGEGEGRAWRLHADRFGTVLTRDHPATPQPTTDPGHGWELPGNVAPVTAVANSEDTMAWTVSTSYRINVLGRVR